MYILYIIYILYIYIYIIYIYYVCVLQKARYLKPPNSDGFQGFQGPRHALIATRYSNHSVAGNDEVIYGRLLLGQLPNRTGELGNPPIEHIPMTCHFYGCIENTPNW